MTKTDWYGKGKLGLLLCLTGLLCLSAPNLSARQSDQQNPPDQANQPDQQSDAGDPPTRVARISYLDGSVSMQPGGAGDWGAAVLNRPMTIGDKLWTDKDSRAELQTGVVSIHLGSMTALSFLNLDQATTQMRISEGSINFRVKEIREGDINEVDTPNAVFTVTQAGAFRLDVDENGDSTGVTVIRGAGQVTAGGKSYDIQAGQRGVFNGTDDVQATIDQAPEPDGLDQWAEDRDYREQESPSAQYVPPDMPGTADLDNNGTWSEQPDYGAVWYPNDVDAGWAPYSVGYWSYIGPWGWTWVDYEPWGFAPFHYGRWAMIGGRWGWCPGPRVGFAVYGPAYVGFLGGGFGVGVGVGWFPLGYGEPYHPWFHCGPRYIETVNIHNTFIRDRGEFRDHDFNHYNYAYAHNVRAVTATSRGAFTGGQAIHRGEAHFTEASLRGAQVSNRVGFSPTRRSTFGAANAGGRVSRPPSRIENRPVMARTTPAANASRTSVRTVNSNMVRRGTFTATNSMQNRPGNNSVPAQRGAANTRSWSAQGATTDRGRAPAGFGSEARANQNANVTVRSGRADRPPWAGNARTNNANAGRVNEYSNRQNNPAANRSYNAPQQRPERNVPSFNREYTPPNRSYTPQPRAYNPPPNRTYTAPSRSYPSPGRSYSPPPSRGGGGGAPRGGGGGSPHGGGGGRPHR
ncbi:MAG TPA: DUF6600 domain-containing protein [Candidatus Acidoferrum sp.]|nr:DUF6600 domain-containing protein [Candidatus Acidoferrum sp.]